MTDYLVRRLALFAQLPASEVEYLAKTLSPREFKANELLMCEGSREEFCYILIDGQVEIIQALDTPYQRRLGFQEPVSFLGEMSFFREGGQHSASVRALTSVKVLVMTRPDFDGLFARQPRLGVELLRTFSARLVESQNQTILDLQERNRTLTDAYNRLQEAHTQIVQKEKLEHELAVGRDIQRSILPAHPPAVPGLDIAALMVPSRIVGGDLYDFILLERNKLGLVIGDVSDKGVPAAIFMALTYSLIRAEAELETSPSKVLAAVNRQLMNMNRAGMFVTVLYGILDMQTREFVYARAGHELPLLLDCTGEEVPIAPTHGQPLGLFDEPIIDEQRLSMPGNDTLVLFTDGVTEAWSPDHGYFGLDNLKTVVQANHMSAAQDLCQQIYQAVSLHTGDPTPQDDITLVGLHLP